MAAQSESERICRKCGRCCCAKLIIEDENTGEDEVVYTPFRCKHLDVNTGLCTIYDNRHEVNPECLNLEDGIGIGVFPADCPYVADIDGYKPPREHWTDEDLELYARADDDKNEEL